MNAIVVVDRNWSIGKNNRLLFSLPEDMKRFRALTLGATVLMGRKTLDSFPGGKPLPKRRNVVLSSRNLAQEGVECVHSLEELRAAGAGAENAFVIGGGSVYAALLPFCRRVYVTKVDAEAAGADTCFPDLDALPDWEIASVSDPVEENGVTYRFVDYVNTRQTEQG